MKKVIETLIVSVIAVVLTACSESETNSADTSVAEQAKEYTVQHIGTATVILKYGDLTILTDPALDAGGGTYKMGPTTLEKTADPLLTADELPSIDVVLLSHDQHPDNLDTEGREFLDNSGLTITTVEGAERLGDKALGLAPWSSHQIGDVTITAVPAQHGPAKAVAMLGTVTGFILSSENGPTVYISGDTVPFPGTDEIVERYAGKIDYSILHTGLVTRGGEKPVHFTMSATDAVTLADQLQTKSFSIIHADSWAHFTQLMPEAIHIAQSSSLAERMLSLANGQVGVIEF